MFKVRIFLWFFVLVLCSITSKIIGKRIAEDNVFPFMVFISRTELDEKGDYSSTCSGALIDNETVLTAAHCVCDEFGNLLVEKDSLSIIAGTSSLLRIDKTTIMRKSKHVSVHNYYNETNKYNDIAVIKLNKPIRLDGIIVDKIPIGRSPIAEGATCTISGWGTGNNSETIAPVGVIIMNKESCRTNYSTYINYEMSNNQLCAGSPDGRKNSCKGDYGGPLICNKQIYGIASDGYRCGRHGLPGIYTDVTKYKDFVDNPSHSNGNSIYSAALKIIFQNIFYIFIIA